jgi:hypothetical protein
MTRISLSTTSLRGVIAAGIFLTVQTVAVAAPTRLSVAFTASDVKIGGITPKGQVVLVGLIREPRGDHSRITPVSVVLDDADGDGTVTYAIGIENNWKAVWGAVDLKSGDFTFARPERSRAREIDFKGQGFGRSANGKLTTVEHEGAWLYMILVQSTGDVDESVVFDGGPLDQDGRQNVIRASIDGFRHIRGKGSKPDEYRPGDVLFVINADDLSMVSARVK